MKEGKARGRRLFAGVVAFTMIAAALVGAGCSSGNTESNSSGDNGTIRIGWIPWDEDVAVTYLWKTVLEEEGYTVELTQLDVGPVFEGMSSGDLDLFFDAWLPTTHSDYWTEYKDSVADLGVWYDNGLLTWAVPEYVDADSIDDLVGQADTFDGQIVGIEPGSGLMRVSINDVVPGYGLDDYSVIEGSTPAMLAELERAIANEEPIVVTLWRPHWAYGVYPIKDLADPQGLLGTAEELHAISRLGFAGDYPEVAEWLGSFSMTDEQLASLENLVINEYATGEEEAAVAAWLEDADNRAAVDEWLGR